jgi:PHD/YefM family antitoxin component YafN of YafNO toxin-antitoxin module
MAVLEDEIRYISDDEGHPTAVIVPIELWRDIASERETRHLLSSEKMKQRLLEARGRRDGIPVKTAFEKLGI